MSDAFLSAFSGWKRRVLVTLFAVTFIAIRKYDSFVNPQFWAEDGGLFFIQSEMWGGWRILFLPYEGYLHVLPRVLSALSASLPIFWAPGFFAWSSLTVSGAVIWWIQSPRIRFPGGWVAALAIALVPHEGEVYLTVCNLQWIMALGLFTLTIADDPANPCQRIGESAMLALCGLTGPFIVLALPFFALRAWQRRSQWSFVLLGVAVACTLAQLPSLLNRPPSEIEQPFAPIHFAAVVSNRAIATMFVGNHSWGETVHLLILVGMAALLVAGLRLRRLGPAGGNVLLASALATLLATGFKARFDTWDLSILTNGDRYFYVAKVILLWILGAFALRTAGLPRLLLLVLLLAPLVSNGRRFIYAPAEDFRWREAARQIEAGKNVEVPILPPGFGFSHPGRNRPANP